MIPDRGCVAGEALYDYPIDALVIDHAGNCASCQLILEGGEPRPIPLRVVHAADLPVPRVCGGIGIHVSGTRPVWAVAPFDTFSGALLAMRSADSRVEIVARHFPPEVDIRVPVLDQDGDPVWVALRPHGDDRKLLLHPVFRTDEATGVMTVSVWFWLPEGVTDRPSQQQTPSDA